MTVIALEKALYELGVQGQARKAYASEPEAFLARYNLSAGERAWLAGFDVAALLRAGVNPMLAMGYWMFLHPSHSMAAYRQAAAGSEAAHG